jgi:hypothetical protein
MSRAVPYLAAVAFLVGAMWWAYSQGIAKCQADHRADMLAQIEAGQKLEAARADEARKREELARKLEEQAYADPVVVEQCLGPDRVRRLNAIR